MAISVQAGRVGGRAGLLVLVAGLLAVPGCGWTPRDEYLHAQRSIVRAVAGDGSRAPLAADWDGPGPVTTATVADAP